MAFKKEVWVCDVCDKEFDTKLEADVCHWTGLDFSSISDIRLGIDCNNECFYFIYELVLWFNDSELRLRMRDEIRQSLDIQEVLFCDEWFSSNVLDFPIQIKRLTEILGDQIYDDHIHPVLGSLVFEIPLPDEKTRESPTLKVE